MRENPRANLVCLKPNKFGEKINLDFQPNINALINGLTPYLL